MSMTPNKWLCLCLWWTMAIHATTSESQHIASQFEHLTADPKVYFCIHIQSCPQKITESDSSMQKITLRAFTLELKTGFASTAFCLKVKNENIFITKKLYQKKLLGSNGSFVSKLAVFHYEIDKFCSMVAFFRVSILISPAMRL